MVLLTELPSGSSSSTHHNRFDVFISFRGVDTRSGFTADLYKALVEADFSTFLDDEEIETGQPLKPELESAIRSSRASVIVLSKNYASSRWCLDELVLILHQMRNSKQIVIPIFYDVEPTNVRKQQKSFGEAIGEHNRRMEAETDSKIKTQLAQKIESWKSALTEVADLKGIDANDRVEAELINDIVKDIYKRIGLPSAATLPQLTGREYYVQLITSWLKDGSQHTADIFTIYGVSGIGKTSLAEYIHKLHHREYVRTFVRDINRRCDGKYHGLLEVQHQLCDAISRKSSLPVHDVSAYTFKIEQALAKKKVLLVLDDVDSPGQLDALLGNKGLYPGSKIIITTKDASLTRRCALFNPQVQPLHRQVLLNGVYESESLELICTHAFESPTPEVGYEAVSEKLVKYCEGHPLALKIFGRSLRTRDVAYWEDCINGLKKEPNSVIKEALQTSFNSLPSKNDKELFKHISCFFVGEDRNLTETVLNACDVNTKSGITNLIDWCLLSIGWNNELMMHSLIQEMGRDLVREESPNKPWKRSRLWCHEESLKVLAQKKGTENLIGLALDTRMLEKEKLSGSLWLETKALNKMENLQLLQLNYVKMSGSYKNFSKELRWLCMHGFHLKSIPSELSMENLVALDLSHSNITSFDMSYSESQRVVNRRKGLIGSSSIKERLLGSLKVLNLRFCEQLCTIGGFFELPLLERLILSNCKSLIEVSESIGYCVELVFIDLSNCMKLKMLPRTIVKLNKVNTLLADGCVNLVFPTDTDSSASVEVIPRDMNSFMSPLPVSLVCLSLGNNGLANKSFPKELSNLTVLKKLNLDGNPIDSMPGFVSSLPSLEELSMQECWMLTKVEHPPSSLRKLDLRILYSSCLVQKLIFNPEMSSLCMMMGKALPVGSTFLIEGMMKIQPLAHVEDEVLRSLGWGDIDLIKIPDENVQICYEFGIFSSSYAGKEMPYFIGCRSTGSSISFTIPSSLNKFRGLNVSYLVERLSYSIDYIRMPLIVVSNVTKNRTWIYRQFLNTFKVAEEDRACVIFVSHWMFGKNEMEDGDQLTISISNLFDDNDDAASIRECGVGFVYENGKMKEDALSYYKSWNHIIGGDLTHFQITTGEYLLVYIFFYLSLEIFPYFAPFVAAARAEYKPEGRPTAKFRAFSQQRSNLMSHQSVKDHRKLYEVSTDDDLKVETQGPKTSELEVYCSVSNSSFVPDLIEDFTPVRPTRKGKEKLE